MIIDIFGRREGEEVDAKLRQLLLSGSVDRKSSNTAIYPIR